MQGLTGEQLGSAMACAARMVAEPSALNTQAGGTHYKDCPIQPIQYIHANGLDFFQGNIVKYATRHKAKNGAEDLRKVIHYAQLALELQYGINPADELADMVRAGKGAQA